MIYENIANKPKSASAVIISYKKKVLLNLRSNKKNILYFNFCKFLTVVTVIIAEIFFWYWIIYKWIIFSFIRLLKNL